MKSKERTLTSPVSLCRLLSMQLSPLILTLLRFRGREAKTHHGQAHTYSACKGHSQNLGAGLHCPIPTGSHSQGLLSQRRVDIGVSSLLEHKAGVGLPLAAPFTCATPQVLGGYQGFSSCEDPQQVSRNLGEGSAGLVVTVPSL